MCQWQLRIQKGTQFRTLLTGKACLNEFANGPEANRPSQVHGIVGALRFRVRWKFFAWSGFSFERVRRIQSCDLMVLDETGAWDHSGHRRSACPIGGDQASPARQRHLSEDV